MKTITLMLAAFLTSLVVKAGDLNSFTGDYSIAETATTCAELAHLEMNNANILIDTETCVDRNANTLTGIYTCDATTMACVVNATIPQQVCPNNTLVLLSSGNILLSNPCRNSSVEMIRVAQ